jgi:hypothetical protein
MNKTTESLLPENSNDFATKSAHSGRSLRCSNMAGRGQRIEGVGYPLTDPYQFDILQIWFRLRETECGSIN